VQDVNNDVGPLALCDLYKKKRSEKAVYFLWSKKIFFKTEIKISTFQDAGYNLSGARDMHTVTSLLIIIYDKLNRFTGSLTYGVLFFYAMGQRKGGRVAQWLP